MDKPQIDLDKLKEYRDKKKQADKPEEEIIDVEGWVLTSDGWKPINELADPYFNRRHLINVHDFDEWG